LARMSFMERSDKFDELLGEARSRGDADLAVVGLLADPNLDPWFRTKAVAALGDLTGPVGSGAIRAEFSAARALFATAKPHNRSWYCDLMCACLWALGKRDGAAATGVLVDATAHPSWVVRDYGFSTLAAVGDDRAWDDMAGSLARRLARKITSERQADEAVWIVRYLARHCAGHSDRSEQLTALLRGRWNSLPVAARQVLAQLYPGAGPSGPASLEVDFARHVPTAPWERPANQQSSV
jgi:hypothetical protein